MKGVVILYDYLNLRRALWRIGDFPEWIANYLSTLPNENSTYGYRIEWHNCNGEHEMRYIRPGYLPMEVYSELLANNLIG